MALNDLVHSPELKNLTRWYELVSARLSASAEPAQRLRAGTLRDFVSKRAR